MSPKNPPPPPKPRPVPPRRGEPVKPHGPAGPAPRPPYPRTRLLSLFAPPRELTAANVYTFLCLRLMVAFVLLAVIAVGWRVANTGIALH